MSAARQSRRELVVESVVTTLAASAGVGIEWLRGLYHAGADLVLQFMPNFAWWWSRPRWLGGWNQWIFAGFPLNADPQGGQFHPFGLLFFLASPHAAAALDGILTPALAAIGMLVYLKRIGCDRTSRLIGALSFSLGGFFIGHAHQPTMTHAAMAVPWALGALEALEGPALVVGLGLASTAILLAGHPQMMSYAVALVLAYAVWCCRAAPWRRRSAVLGGFGLAAALTAVVWLPASELISFSIRAVGAAHRDAFHLTLRDLCALVAPFCHGTSVGPIYGWSPPAIDFAASEATGYPGMLVLLILLGALPALLRDSRARFWLAFAVLALGLGSGAGDLLIPLRGMRAPSRVLLWWSFAAPIAAALALSSVRQSSPARRYVAWWVAALIVASVIAASSTVGGTPRRAALGSAAFFTLTASVLAAALRYRGSAFWHALVLVALVDLIAFGASTPFGMTPASYQKQGWALRAARELGQHDPAARQPLARSLMLPAMFDVNWAPFAGERSVQGYNPVALKSTAALLGQNPTAGAELGWTTDVSLAQEQSHVLDLLRCDLVVGFTRIPNPLGDSIRELAEAGSARWEEVPSSDPELKFYRNRRARPVAWLVRRVQVVNDQEALRLVRGAGGDPVAFNRGDPVAFDRGGPVASNGGAVTFDPGREALTDRPIAGIRSAGGETREDGRAGSEPVAVVDYQDDEIRLVTEPSLTSLLVTSEIAYPGWDALLDTRPTRLYTVNAGFRAVVVPPGRHEIVLRYRPLPVRIGLTIGAVGSLVLIVLTFQASTGSAARRLARAERKQ